MMSDLTLLATMEAVLTTAAVRVRAAKMKTSSAAGAGHASIVIIIASGMAVTAALFGGMFSLAWLVFGLGVMAAFVVILIRLFRAYRHPIDLVDVAQRLDYGAGKHNRIATAYDLLRTGVSGPFAWCAVSNGLNLLKSVPIDRIFIEPTRPPIRCIAVGMGAALLFAVVIMFGPQHGVKLVGISAIDETIHVADLAGADESKPRAATRPKLTVPPSREKSLANGQAATSKSGSNAASVGSASASTGTGAASASASAAGKESKDARAERSVASSPRSDQSPANSIQSAASAAGSSGDSGSAGGASPPSGSTGRSGEPSPPAKADGVDAAAASAAATATAGDTSAAAATDDQPSPPPQGGGAPLRQDRGGQASRELGQSGNTGDSGNGRGGPSAAKKARGTSAIFLSVPLPDDVPGQLTAGPSRMSVQSVPPRRGDMAPASAVSAAGQAGVETPVSRFDIPNTSAGVVDRYFRSLRAESPEVAP